FECFLLLGQVRAVLAVLLDQYRNLFGGLGTDAQPIGDTFAIENRPSVGIRHTRIVRSEIFEYSAIAGGILIECTAAKKGTMGPTHLLHADSDGHVVLLALSLATPTCSTCKNTSIPIRLG